VSFFISTSSDPQLRLVSPPSPASPAAAAAGTLFRVYPNPNCAPAYAAEKDILTVSQAFYNVILFAQSQCHDGHALLP